MSLIKLAAGFGAGIFLFGGVASADDDERSMSLIELTKVDPAKMDQYRAAWKTVKELAEEHEYPFPTFAGGYRNDRWTATPITSYGDIDAVYAARGAVYDAAGETFQDAISALNNSTAESHSFVSINDKELSHMSEGSATGAYMEIDSFRYRAGKRKEVAALIKEYNMMIDAKGIDVSYATSWDALGSTGPSVTFITYTESPSALAAVNQQIYEAFDGDEAAEDLFDRWNKVVLGSERITSWFSPGASINIPEDE